MKIRSGIGPLIAFTALLFLLHDFAAAQVAKKPTPLPRPRPTKKIKPQPKVKVKAADAPKGSKYLDWIERKTTIKPTFPCADLKVKSYEFNMKDYDPQLRSPGKGYLVYAANGKNREFLEWNVDGDNATLISRYEFDCNSKFLMVDVGGWEWKNTKYVDLLNGFEMDFLNFANWSPDKKYYLRVITRQDATLIKARADVQLWGCLNRSLEKSCEKLWEDDEVNVGVRKIQWSPTSVSFSSGKAGDDPDFPEAEAMNVFKVTCQLGSDVSCKKTKANPAANP